MYVYYILKGPNGKKFTDIDLPETSEKSSFALSVAKLHTSGFLLSVMSQWARHLLVLWPHPSVLVPVLSDDLKVTVKAQHSISLAGIFLHSSCKAAKLKTRM